MEHCSFFRPELQFFWDKTYHMNLNTVKMPELHRDPATPEDLELDYELDLDLGDDEPDFQESDYVMDHEEPEVELDYQDNDYGVDWLIRRRTVP